MHGNGDMQQLIASFRWGKQPAQAVTSCVRVSLCALVCVAFCVFVLVRIHMCVSIGCLCARLAQLDHLAELLKLPHALLVACYAYLAIILQRMPADDSSNGFFQ